MKLNLGCGTDVRPGWVNIDSRPDVGADLVLDITRQLPFGDSSVKEVLAQDILEHLTTQQLHLVLAQISRVLRSGGRLHVRLPDVDAIISKFSADADTRNLFLYGDTMRSGVWGAHKSGYSLKSFASLCLMHHFKLLNYRLADTNLELEFAKFLVDLKPKKILFINQSLGIGGAETFNRGLLSWLKRQGIIIDSWVTHPDFARQVSGHRLPVVLDIIGDWKGLVKAIFLWLLGAVMYWWVVWQARDADIILLTGFIEKIIVTPIARILNIAVVWVEFGPLETIFGKFWSLPKLLYRLVSTLPEMVIMPSFNTQAHNVPAGHIPLAKTRVIPCAEDISLKKVKPQKNLVVCVSRLEPGKGQDILLDAWPEVVRRVPGAKLRIIGEGNQYQNLKYKISNLKLPNSVELVGWVKDAIAEIAVAKVCVFPSVWPLEGFGLVMVEAMALDKPVVAFDTGPVSEILDKTCGVLVPPSDVDKLAEGIIKMLRSPTAGGRKKYLAKYTWAKVGPQYLEVFKYVLATHQAV